MRDKLKQIKEDIYPFSAENFNAVVEFYFTRNFHLNWNKSQQEYFLTVTDRLKLYEFEFLASQVIKNIDLFHKVIKQQYLTVPVMLHYAEECFFANSNFAGSQDKIGLLDKLNKRMLDYIENWQ